MRYRTLFVALMVGVAVVPAPAAADVVGRPELDASFADNTVAPGEDTALTLQLINRGELREGSNRNPQLNSQVTTARGLTVTVKDGNAPIDVETGTQAVGSLPEGAAPPMSIPISVDSDAEPGTYTVDVVVDYTYTRTIEDDGDRITRTERRTIPVTLVVTEEADLTVVDVTSDLRVGSTGTVNVTVENTGSAAAEDAALVMESANADLSFGTAASATRHVGTWQPGDRHTLSYEVTAVRSATSQRYAMDVVARYEDQDGVPRRKSVNTIGVTPAPEQAFSVVNATSSVAVGDSGTVTVTLRNAGPLNVSDAEVQLRSASSSLHFAGSPTTSRFVGSWGVGETRTVKYDVTAAESAETRSYTLTATVSYRDEEGDAATAPSRSLGVTPDPEQSFAIANVSADLAVGKEGTLRGTVTNTGGTVADSAVVTYASQSGTVTPIETESPVGTLAPGESAQFAIPLAVSDDAEPGPKQFSLAVQYRNQDDEQRRSDTMDVRAEVGPEQTFDIDDVSANLAVGEEGTLTGTVTNTGGSTIDNAVVVYTSTSATVTALETESPVGTLEPGESAEFSIPLEVSSSAEAGPKQFSLAVQYRNQDDDQRRSDTIDVRTDVAPDEPAFTIETTGASAAAGGSTTMRVTVTNNGDETYTDISAKLFTQEPLASSDDEAFISRLEPGQSKTVTFSVAASGSALEKTYPLSMDFQYDDSEGESITSDTYRFAFQVEKNASGGGGGLPLVPIAVLVVLVAVGIYAYRAYTE